MRKKIYAGFLAILFAVIAITLLWIKYQYPVATIGEARAFFRSRQFDRAERLATEIARKNPVQKREALLLATRAAIALSRYDTAWGYAEQILLTPTPVSIEDGSYLAEVAFRAGHLQVSISLIEQLVERYPNQIEVRKRLIYLYGLTGRNYEALPHLRWLLDNNGVELNTLLLLGAPTQVVSFQEVLDVIHKQNPKDPSLQLALGRTALTNQKVSDAREHLISALDALPRSMEAQASLGFVEFELKNRENVLSWWQRIKGTQIAHPLLWITLGRWAKELGEYDYAYSCFLEAAKLDSNNDVVFYLLSDEYKRRGNSEFAKLSLERHKNLNELSRLCVAMFGRNPASGQILQVASLCRLLGRTKESYAWCTLIARGVGNPVTVDLQHALSIQESLAESSSLTWNQPGSFWDNETAAVRIDAELFSSVLDSHVFESVNGSPHGIVFADVAERSGLAFSYFTGPKPNSEARQLYEFAGGGIGVFDFDRDGWPDVLLSQGCTWPPQPLPERIKFQADPATSHSPNSTTQYSQVLYRNLAGKGWRNISDVSLVDFVAYGQGIACGDVNSDGFEDAYVACIGRNLLLINNGDGTFDELSERYGINSSAWTTSCAIADINMDGLADIYDVNYLKGEDLFTRECIWEGNRKRICGPGTFEACQDQVWVNSGSDFVEQSRELGLVASDGKGLGIVIGSFLFSKANCIFVANDQTANHLFSRMSMEGITAPKNSEMPTLSSRFENIAEQMGVAFDGTGAMQGCMGVAVSDFDKNGYLDIFVTNYVTESNTLYSQRNVAQFEDLTRRAMLREPSISMVGFGCQSIDPLLEGNIDIVVANGHLDHFEYKGQAYEMPTQYFRNDGNGRFTELANGWKGYWAGKYLGRSMAKLDWNLDGREDLIVAHLNAPVALLENQSITVGNSITISLVGTASSRDSIGTQVKVKSVTGEQFQTLMAGNGYQCSNEKQLVFGLGDSAQASSLEISWIGGSKDRFESVLPGKWIAIEGVGLFQRGK